MDYKERYEKALKRAETAINIAADKDLVKGVATTIFPELRESEDEKRVKAIAILEQQRNYWSYDLPDADKLMPPVRRKDLVEAIDIALAYLEKQKDKMTAEEFESSELFQLKLKTKYANGYQDGLAQKETHYTKRNALFDKCVAECDPEIWKQQQYYK